MLACRTPGATMARSDYSRNDLGTEVQAPWGYYQALEEATIDYAGRRVLYTLGSACVEASCCGKGSWSYARVEGYAVEGDTARGPAGDHPVQVDTIETPKDRAAIAQLVTDRHPGVRVEFR
jgi:hypothetical protein